ncbi:hypothetical protein B0A48_04529 [Cryoendolithus antarcticus]|uniref:Uncharacterized protein n=1 Tax=Cryoendolithus antarcticus TaxID=1507870 RepID=A0A1V8TG37_9PEZI|nr:hypothetical protein B0A48_04529 [Cryoendolithus antarcticus]
MLATATGQSALQNIQPSCAICGAASTPECAHEGDRLKLALDQAMARWQGVLQIREWVLIHARNSVINTFAQLKAARAQAHIAYLQTLPCYTLFQRYGGNPPLPPQQLALLHTQISNANGIFRQGIDEDWRRSCLRYPEVLDYYFSLVEVSFPDEQDSMVRTPRFGAQAKEPKKVKSRRDSLDMGSEKGKKRDRRRDGGRTPPPEAPMAGRYGRR